MARKLPTIPEHKMQFYRNKLWREVSNLFKWEGMPDEIPLDYLERTLVTSGRILFFHDEDVYGYMALKANIKGYNLYEEPTEATCTAPNDAGLTSNFERKIIHKYDKNIEKNKSAVLINNMYKGEPLWEIVEHYAKRLTMVQNAFDTNAVWQNIPVTWSATDEKIKTTIDEWFETIYDGEPLIIVDKSLLAENAVIADVTEVPFLLDKLFDAKNEIYNEFKSTIGLNAPGADKKERLVVAEATSNQESKDNCLNIMLSQREIACEEINKVFGLSVSVRLATDGGEDNGQSDDGTEERTDNGEPEVI